MANDPQIGQLIETTRMAAAASMAGGMIAATQRPHSIQEAQELVYSCYFALFPAPGRGRYDSWKNQTKVDEPHK